MTMNPTFPDLASNGQAGNAVPASAPSADPTGVVPREVRNLLGDIEYLIEETTSITGEDLMRAKARIGERIAAVRQAIDESGTALAQGTRRNADIANRYVHEQPWAMIGIGVALGGLLGFALARRS